MLYLISSEAKMTRYSWNVYNMNYIAIVVGFLSLLGARVCAQSVRGLETEEPVGTVRAYLDTLEQAGFSGAVLVEFHGKIVISKGYGYSDMLHGRRNSSRTVFDIGSVTKQFTAAAILKLEMEGRLSTDDKLSRFFRKVPGDKSDITVHQLLRHSSGLKSNVGRDYDSIAEAAFIDSVMKSPLKFSPGTAFSYSNVGYSLLAIIIGKVAGVPYETFLYENLWRPAGMEHTGYRRPDFEGELIAVGYYNDDRIWGRPTEKPWGADGPYWHLKGNGGILSTAEDLFRWNQALATDKILSTHAKAKMYRPGLRNGEDSASYYAYGWDVHRTSRNTLSLWHNGSNGIFYADFYRYPDEGTTVIVLTNRSNGFQDTGREISRTLFDPTHRPVVPIPDNESNRTFTDHVIALTIQEGFEAGARGLGERKPGANLLEDRVNNKGYELLGGGGVSQAVGLFKINVLAFPASANAYDSLGEGYLVAGDTTLAIEHYRKSLALDPGNANAEKVLKHLEAK
jgi:CubicO group peptidase (beta-lactamase class C family)